jgi:NADH-quinone oxidoreductase subunit L
MQIILLSFFMLPLIGFLLSLVFKNHQEKSIARVAIYTSGIHVVLTIGFFFYWLSQGRLSLNSHILTIYQTEDFKFSIDLFYDKLTAVYSIVASILIFIVSIFSKTYMHRESGFKRFYNHFLLFFIGINALIIAGNFETFFLGWEIIGISSFLLISFYCDRYLPVRNALKVLSFYRLGDVALIGAMWFCHHLFHSNVLFKDLGEASLLYVQNNNYAFYGLLISLLLILAAAIKSAQFPFSSWLPRSMEGPTVSSAIFYGSLSVHVGVFLLIRTYPIWSDIFVAKIIIILIGVLTAVIASFIGSVQPTAKTQIAYSSITQIGLMFIEIALGWHVFALVHFSANAFLRSYQLLVSPSVMSYLIHEQFFNYDILKKQPFQFLPKKLYNSIYMLSIKEFNLDFVWYQYVWMSFKKLGRSFTFLRTPAAQVVFAVLMLIGIFCYLFQLINYIKYDIIISSFYATIAFVIILIAWTERASAIRAWLYIAFSQVFFMLAIVEQHHFTWLQIAIYFCGTFIAFLGGLWCLNSVKTQENNVNLNQFHGHIYEHPKYGLLFLICALIMVGFPISPTFIGLDILFSKIRLNHWLLLILSSFTFIVLELAVLRIYARMFLGQHIKTYHEVAFRNS